MTTFLKKKLRVTLKVGKVYYIEKHNKNALQLSIIDSTQILL